MKRERTGNPIANLYDQCEKATSSSASRSIRNKLSDRDLRRAKFTIQRDKAKRIKPTLGEMTELINDTKDYPMKVDQSTLSRHLHRVDVERNSKKGDFPDNVDLPRWLARRRSFCDKFKKLDKSDIIVGDEAFFGLAARQRMHEKDWQIDGHAAIAKYNA